MLTKTKIHDPVCYWTWLNSDIIAIVTDTAVFHWSLFKTSKFFSVGAQLLDLDMSFIILSLTLNLLNFLNGLVYLPFFGTLHFHFQGYLDMNLELDSQQYKAWSDCIDVQSSLALNWWQWLATSTFSRISVKFGRIPFPVRMAVSRTACLFICDCTPILTYLFSSYIVSQCT